MIKKYTTLILAVLFVLCCIIVNADVGSPFVQVESKHGEKKYSKSLDSIPGELSLDTTWKFHAGDDFRWASAAFNDNSWDTLRSDLKSGHAPDQFKGMGWFRIRLKISPSLFHKTFALNMSQDGASEIFLNGKRIYKFGVVSTRENEVPFDPSNNTYFIEFGSDTIQLIAVRYSAWTALEKHYKHPGFSITLKIIASLNSGWKMKQAGLTALMFFFTMFLVLTFFHFLLFIFYRKNRSNLYFSLLAAVLSIIFLCTILPFWSSNPFIGDIIEHILYYIFTPFFLFIVLSLYSIFSIKLRYE